MNDPTAHTDQPRNPLHGVTLEAIVRALEAHYGWEELARKIPIWSWSCPNSPDTLTFLNKAIGFNDIGIQFFNTQAPFKFVG